MSPKSLRPADRGWLVLWVWVFTYDLWAARQQGRGHECEALSEAVDRYMIARRWPTEIWLALFYIHLSNRVPDRYDPIHWASVLLAALPRMVSKCLTPTAECSSQTPSKTGTATVIG